VNKYIEKLCTAFTSNKKGAPQLIKSTLTYRPYLYIDKVREAFLRYIELLKLIAIDEFEERLLGMNKKLLRMLELQLATGGCPKKDQSIAERCIELQFALAFDTKLDWIREM
jgi:hypothetical protein